jgi:hypothetical protein
VNLRECPDGLNHAWGALVPHVDRAGREWEVTCCTRCGVGSLRLVEDPASSADTFLDLLAIAHEHREAR